MPRYRAYGTVFESDFPFPELPGLDGEEPEYTFRLTSLQAHHSGSVQWFQRWGESDEEPWLCFGRQERGYVLRFPRFAEFYIPETGRNVSCRPELKVPAETIRHLFLDLVLPLALSQKRASVLHGSAVMTSAGAVAFLGKTGSGKSTLAASFTRRGFPLITDDCLCVEEQNGKLLALPGYPGLRLWQDAVSAVFGSASERSVAHYTEKKRVGCHDWRLGFCPDSVPLRRVYFLEPSEGHGASNVQMNSASPREAFLELVQNAYKLDASDRDKLRTEFSCFSRIAALPVFFRLRYRRNFSILPGLLDRIGENLELDRELAVMGSMPIYSGE